MGERVAEYEAALLAGREAMATEPRAQNARYDRRSGRLVVVLTSGVELRIPTVMAQGLQNAAPVDLVKIEISPSGYGLHFPRLDADLSVPALFAGVYGSRTWMRQLAAKGGAVSTTRKAAAARANGQLGGRPRKLG